MFGSADRFLDNGNLADAVMSGPVQRFRDLGFDLARFDPESPHLDHVVRPAQDLVFPVFGASGPVAGPEPCDAVRLHPFFRAQFRLPVVFPGHVAAVDQ